MANSIHLIEHLGNMKRLDGSQSEWESGWWAVSADTATRLVGGAIYFHKAKAKASFFGGNILGFRIEDIGEFAGRVVFRFRPTDGHRDVRTDARGWGFEKKIVIAD